MMVVLPECSVANVCISAMPCGQIGQDAAGVSFICIVGRQ